MAQSDKVMQEVQQVTNTYDPLAQASSRIFFAMLSLGTVHYLYQFSLQFFMETVYTLLNKNEGLHAIPKTESQRRLDYIFNELFIRIYHRVSHSLLNSEKLIFALRLAQIKLGTNCQEQFQAIIRTATVIETKLSPTLLQGKLSNSQMKFLEELSNQDRFKNLVGNLEANESGWLAFLDASNPEDVFPKGWENADYETKEAGNLKGNLKDVSIACRDLAIVKLFRPDKFALFAQKLINVVLAEKFLDVPPLDLGNVVEKESTAKSPILLCSAPGFDASYKVEQLVKETGKKLTSVAIGSAEGFELAEKAITGAAKSGNWVLLKNVHLAPSWLSEVEKKIHRLQTHDSFRLFLTMEFNPKVPATLLRQSYKFVFEPPDGIKASLIRTFKTVLTPQRTDKFPIERARLHFILAWIHAVIQERLRYTPIGWTKVYEFNEADQRCALDLIDEHIDGMGERQNVDPSKMPWDTIKCILTQNLYGGKIDNEYDNKILISLADQFCCSNAFDRNFQLFAPPDGTEPMLIPEATRYSQFNDWIEKLPATESPAWSGLPTNVEKILREQLTNHVVSKLWEIQDVTEDDNITIEVDSKDKKKESEGQVKWLKQLGDRVKRYIDILPANLDKVNRSANSINDPLFRFIEREVTVASNLLSRVRTKLHELKNVCEGVTQSTSELRQLAQDIYQEIIPATWKKYNILKIPVTEWIPDFKKRLDQFQKIMNVKNYQKKGVWMGGLLFPEAYLTATRQYVAQNNKWSLEELDLKIEIYDGRSDLDDDSFLITGMTIEGAEWDAQTKLLKLNKDLSALLPPLVFKWIKVDKDQLKVTADDELFVPVYLNKSRANLIFSVKMNCGNLQKTQLYQRGLALIAWNQRARVTAS
eukprot:TRINITY_DN567_c0_g1_i1.p1 TRINITY_DN567_c0_g1~~TRINITY_DN567_c0_g1_i1.p1  ORF type:complete len:874 (+),score=315.79 TRINITY_DN567_c0_g1_i1:204-2825(+)